MEYSKCQQGDDEEEEEDYNDDNGDYNEQEEFEDEPAERQIRRRQRSRHDDDEYIADENKVATTAAATTKTMIPLEMESSNDHENSNHYNEEVDDDDDQHDGAEDDAMSLLGSEAGGGGGAAAAGDFYISHSNSNASTDGSTYSSGRRSTSGGRAANRGINRYRYRNNINGNNEITLREMAAVQGKTCCPLYFCAVILLILLVAAIFVAPPSKAATTTTPAADGNGDSHYRSPASNAEHQQEQQQQLQCELDITGDTSWDVLVQNVSNPSFGNRCSSSSGNDQQQQQQTTTTCLCENPTVPDFPHQPSSYAQRWQQTFQQNLDRIAQWETISSSLSSSAQSDKNNNINNHLDVVFLGDSITEHWVGTDLSRSQPQKWSGNVHVFQSLFGNVSATTPAATIKSSTTNLMGMALGLSGDRCRNLLYRLQNGELLSESVQPSIFWILIGTNDVGGGKCLPNQVIAGTIAIIKYIQQERPNAKIVVNSILPAFELDRWRKMYQPINQAMDCFVQGFQQQQQQQQQEHDGNNKDDDDDDDSHGDKLYFFNATDLFLTSDRQSINYTLLPDALHPGEEGSWIWGRAMVEKIQDILTS